MSKEEIKDFLCMVRDCILIVIAFGFLLALVAWGFSYLLLKAGSV